MAITAEERPDLVEQVVSPFVDVIARGVTNYNRSFIGPAEGLLRAVIEHATVACHAKLPAHRQHAIHHSGPDSHPNGNE